MADLGYVDKRVAGRVAAQQLVFAYRCLPTYGLGWVLQLVLVVEACLERLVLVVGAAVVLAVLRGAVAHGVFDLQL